jgi:hypothetical protein
MASRRGLDIHYSRFIEISKSRQFPMEARVQMRTGFREAISPHRSLHQALGRGPRLSSDFGAG